MSFYDLRFLCLLVTVLSLAIWAIWLESHMVVYSGFMVYHNDLPCFHLFILFKW